MRTLERRQYDMLARVREFGNNHRDLFPESSLGAQALATVAATVEQLKEHAISKVSAAKGGGDRKAQARDALMQQLEAISRTARGIARDTEGFKNTFRFSRRQAESGFVTDGRAFAKDAETFKSHFLAHGLPATFIADLLEAVETFEQAIRDREVGKDGHVYAQASIEASLGMGLAAVRTLDTIVSNQLRDDPATMEVWMRDRRVEHSRRRKSNAATAAPALEASAATGGAGASQGSP